MNVGLLRTLDDFMLCKAENRDPANCLKEGRRVTRCAQDLYVPLPCTSASHHSQLTCDIRTQNNKDARELPQGVRAALELLGVEQPGVLCDVEALNWAPMHFGWQEYQYCRKPERALNKCMFEKLVSISWLNSTISRSQRQLIVL